MARQEAIRRELTADASDTFTVSSDTAEAARAIVDGMNGETPLDAGVNEVLMFHGTNAIAADKISTDDFKVNLAGSNAGTLYGRGIYLAENSSKSDEYADPDPTTQMHTLLVCRVTLGRPHYTAEVNVDPRTCEDACLKSKFHSVLGDRKACRGTFREFVVFDEEQVYTNYILNYKRVYRPIATAIPKTSGG